MRGISLLVLFLAALGLRAQSSARFRQYTVDQGLAQNSIYDIAQDNSGFIWLATQDGLSRFDGYSFVNYHPVQGDTSSLTNNSVRALLVDSRGWIWVATRRGLNCYEPLHDKFRQYLHDDKNSATIAEDITLALCEDREGRIWVGTANTGVSIIDVNSGSIRQLRHLEGSPNSLCGDDVRGLLCDARGHIWISTWQHGVDEYDPATAKFRHLSYENGRLAFPKTRGTMIADRTGKIWLGSWGRGVALYDPVKDTSVILETLPGHPEMKLGMIWDMMEDRNGRIWLATAEQGLFLFDPVSKKSKNFRNDPDDPGSLSDNNTWCVMQDRGGLIWAGTWQGGLNVYDARLERFGRQTHRAKDSLSLPNGTVWSFCESPDGEVWIGTGDGPFLFDPATGKYRRPELAPGAKPLPLGINVQGICLDQSGLVWMGTAGSGPLYYDTGRKVYRQFEPYLYPVFATGSVSDVFCDSEGQVWIGGSDGLARYNRAEDDFKVYVYNPDDTASISDRNVNCIIEKDRDHLWLSTVSEGFCLFDKRTGKCRRYGKDTPGLRSANISTLFLDRFGRLWVGTSGGGLHVLDEKTGKLTHFGAKEGFLNEVINAISEGAPGELWISTNRGICRLETTKKEVSVFLMEDGLQGNEFNQNAVMRSADGRIWFGGTRGYNVFHPKDIRQSETPAHTVITAVTALNKPLVTAQSITYTRGITLSYRDYFFSISFAGLEYTNPSRNQYRYRLEGFDEDWVEAGDRRFVTYTNLDPGDYVFHVSSSNADGFWSDEVTSLKITITPPFWRTTWFYVLCAAAVILLIWLYIRWRERRLRREKLLLEQKVTERTSELHEEKEKVVAAHKDIRDSINYARRIQDAILPHDEEFVRLFPESFVLYQPRDIVSGDFYWAARVDEGDGEKLLLAVADCTGHGVPGALMSMIGHTLLNEIVKLERISDPALILGRLHTGVRTALKQGSGNETRDGMDIALLCYEPAARLLHFAGANRPLVYFSGGRPHELRPDKQAIGGLQDEQPRRFNRQTIELGNPGETMIYVFSDGYADQFGGEKGKKFMMKRLNELLEANHALPPGAQKERLLSAIEAWKGSHEQVDDMLIVGIRI